MEIKIKPIARQNRIRSPVNSAGRKHHKFLTSMHLENQSSNNNGKVKYFYPSHLCKEIKKEGRHMN